MGRKPTRSKWPSQQRRAGLYTLNVEHFCRLHREFLSTGREHAGIVVIPRQRYSIGEKVRCLLSFIEAVTAEEMKNRLEYL